MSQRKQLNLYQSLILDVVTSESFWQSTPNEREAVYKFLESDSFRKQCNEIDGLGRMVGESVNALVKDFFKDIKYS